MRQLIVLIPAQDTTTIWEQYIGYIHANKCSWSTFTRFLSLTHKELVVLAYIFYRSFACLCFSKLQSLSFLQLYQLQSLTRSDLWSLWSTLRVESDGRYKQSLSSPKHRPKDKGKRTNRRFLCWGEETPIFVQQVFEMTLFRGLFLALFRMD